MLIKAIALPVFALAFAVMFAGFYRVLSRRKLTGDALTKFLIAEAGLLLVLVLTPAWVSAAVSLACAFLMLGVTTLCTVVRMVARYELRRERTKARLRLIEDPAQLSDTVGAPDAWQVEQANELMSKGFRQAEHGIDEHGQTVLLLFRDDDSVAAEVVTPAASEPRLPVMGVVELTSVLEGHRGALCTNSAMPSIPGPFWKGEIRQHFPGASAAALVDEHERATRVLQQRGIRLERYPFERVHDERTWGLRMAAAAQVSTSTRAIFRDIRENALQPQRTFGRLEDDASLWERLRDLPEATYSVPD